MSEERPATHRQRQAREERLAQAMRDNLKKRKAQERLRQQAGDRPSPAGGDDSDRSR